MVEALKKNPAFTPRRGPVVLAILDGVGFGKYEDGDAVKLARTPVLDSLMKNSALVLLPWKWRIYYLPQSFVAVVYLLSCVQLFPDPVDCSHQPFCQWNFPGKNTGVGCHFLL